MNIVRSTFRLYNPLGLSRSAQFNDNPVQIGHNFTLDSIYSPVSSCRYQQMLVNSILNSTNSLKKIWQLKGTTHINLREHILGNNLIFQLNGFYDHTDNTMFSLYNLRQPQIDQTDYRNQYSLQPAMNYNYKAVAAYKWTFSRFEKLEFQLSHAYNQEFRRGHRDLFRLDKLEERRAGRKRPDNLFAPLRLRFTTKCHGLEKLFPHH